jgi:hypothetical protein
MEDFLDKFCFIHKDTNIVEINYLYFKLFHTFNEKELFLTFFISKINKVLLNNDNFIIYVKSKKLTLIDIDKHKLFIQQIATKLKLLFENKLDKCYIYDSSIVFSQIFNLLSFFIDKQTLNKIIFVK